MATAPAPGAMAPPPFPATFTALANESAAVASSRAGGAADKEQDSMQLLEDAARSGGMEDISQWPQVLEALLQRLHDIVHNDFPIPVEPPQPVVDDEDEDQEEQQSSQIVASTPPPLPSATQESKQTDDSLSKSEEAIPASQSSAKDSLDAPAAVSSELDTVRTTFGYDVALAHPEQPSSTLPPPLEDLYTHAHTTLSSDFPHAPPHTLQRLAELILRPRQHYRFLPSYLRAVDRIVSVSSPVTEFPLARSAAGVNGLAHDAHGEDQAAALGGAALEPIPWLRGQLLQHEEGDSALSPGRLVTQGELLRQEQQAGVVLSSEEEGGAVVYAPTTAVVGSTTAADAGLDDADEIPHARGPEEIGVADTGLQSRPLADGSGPPAIDIDAAVGRSSHVDDEATMEEAGKDLAAEDSHEHPAAEKEEERDEEKSEDRSTEVQAANEAESKDADGDISIAEAPAESDAPAVLERQGKED